MSAADPVHAAHAGHGTTRHDASVFERWWWQLAAWSLAAVNVYLLPFSPLTFAGFCLVYPALWVTHRTPRSASAASLIVGVGITARLAGTISPEAAALFGALSSAGSISIGLWLSWIDSLRERTNQALADKEEALAATQRALDELAAAQEALVAVERAAATSAERQRWAHEVHDTLAQSFVSLITLVQLASTSTGDEARAIHEHMDAISREGLCEARALIAGDHSALLSDGLGHSLTRLVQAQADHGARVPDLELRLDRDLAAPVEAVVLRVVQEALTNVRRHAQASWSAVEVTSTDGEVVVRVEDDGVGLAGAPEGAGLTGMRQRLEALGGSLTVDPARHHPANGLTGTLLEARIPA